MHDLILRAWQDKNIVFYLILIPLSWLFAALTALRRYLYKLGLIRSYKLSVPVIVVGNINMGGSGKTPVVIWLVNQLKQKGFKPGVISRGYGASVKKPRHVKPNSQPHEVGDEPILIAKKTDCPVWVSPNRVEAGNALLKANPMCDIIISDDGLQHYRLQRQIEMVVVDSQTERNQHLLPAGPLREPFSRLKQVDAIISNGNKSVSNAYDMHLKGLSFYNLLNPEVKETANYFNNKNVTALAGIGQPERFFAYLKELGLHFESMRFDDHYAFTESDFAHIQCDALIMTEKDAVKCQSFAEAHHWVLPVEAEIDVSLIPMLLSKLQKTNE